MHGKDTGQRRWMFLCGENSWSTATKDICSSENRNEVFCCTRELFKKSEKLSPDRDGI